MSSVIVNFLADLRNFRAGLGSMGDDIRAFAGRAGQVMGGVLGAEAVMGGFRAATQFAMQGLQEFQKTAAEMAKMELIFERVGVSPQALQNIKDKIGELEFSTGIDGTELAGLFGRGALAGVRDQAELINRVNFALDAQAMVGMDAARVMTALNKSGADNVVMLRQLAQGAGVQVNETDTVNDVLKRLSEQLRGTSDAAQSAKGALGELEVWWGNIRKDLGEDLANAANNTIKSVRAWMDDNSAETEAKDRTNAQRADVQSRMSDVGGFFSRAGYKNLIHANALDKGLAGLAAGVGTAVETVFEASGYAWNGLTSVWRSEEEQRQANIAVANGAAANARQIKQNTENGLLDFLGFDGRAVVDGARSAYKFLNPSAPMDISRELQYSGVRDRGFFNELLDSADVSMGLGDAYYQNLERVKAEKKAEAERLEREKSARVAPNVSDDLMKDEKEKKEKPSFKVRPATNKTVIDVRVSGSGAQGASLTTRSR